MSFTSPYNQSNYSLHGQGLNTRISNMSNDGSQKYLRKTISNSSQRQSQLSNAKQQSWTSIISKFKSNKNQTINFKQTHVWQSTDTV